MVYSFLMNLKINIHGNIEPDENVIYVSNHVGGFDFFVLKYLLSKYRRNLYTVVYDNMVDIKGYIKFCLYNIKHIFYDLLNFICYKRGDKESGSDVKSKILDLFKKENCNLLIFPSGYVSNNINAPFKPGIFKLAAENNIKIRPITLKYNKILLNQNRSKNFSLEEWFNLTVDVYIHEIQQNSNWEILMKDCYELISKI